MKPGVVLLVDDEVPFVETMTKRLKKRNLNVLTAFDGSEGLKRLDENPNVDVVILDVKMPGMDGIATLREMKRAHPLVEVVMLTGHATVETAIEGMKLGAYDYLMKPCEMDDLMGKLEEATTKKRDQERRISEAKAKHIVLRRGD